MLIALENRASGCNIQLRPLRVPIFLQQGIQNRSRFDIQRAIVARGPEMYLERGDDLLHRFIEAAILRGFITISGQFALYGAYKTRPCLHPAMRPRQTPGINVPMKTKGRDQFCAAAQYPNDPQPYAARSDIGRRSPAQARLPPETVLLDNESTAAPLKADLDLRAQNPGWPFLSRPNWR